MEAIEITAKYTKVILKREELLIINSALNEIFNGIEIFEFDSRIGADRNQAAALLKEVVLLLDEMDRRV